MVVATDFDREVCSRLPLAEASWRLLDFVTQDDFLAGVFARHKGRSYEDTITFPLFVHLIADALLQHHGSGHQSFTRAREDGELTTWISAAYGKLARVPLGLSQGFFAEASARLIQVIPAPQRPLPASVARFQVVAFDGKKIKHVAHRLKATRRVAGNLLGGKLVVGLHLNTNLALAFQAHPDGQFGDQGLVPGLLGQLRPLLPGPRLFVGDRIFCDLNQPGWLTEDGDHFVLRYCKKVKFYKDESKPSQEGTDAKGRRWVQEWGWLGGAKDPRRRYVRRITLYRPGEEDVSVVTDLLDEVTFPAADILEVYLLRWGIEHCFQEITEVFELGQLIGTTPQATVFQAGLCLLLYNVVQVLRGYLAVCQGRQAETISTEQVFTDVKRQLIAWDEVLTPQTTVALLRGKLTAEQLRQKLAQLLAEVWSERWLKAKPRKATPKKKAKKEDTKGGHASVFRLLNKARSQEQVKQTG
jgi:Transposase DDE domain